MGQELSGKVAIITGGTLGIGRAAVELFIEEGAKVVIADVDQRGEDLAKKLGGAVRFKRTDVSDATQVQELVDFAVAEFGGLNIMYNNAGISDKAFCRFMDDDFVNFEPVMRVNVLGTMLCGQRAARYMAKNGGGSIINTASIAAILASFGVSTYRASKAAVTQLTKGMAIDLAEYGIRVNCLIPGHIVTGIIASSMASNATARQAEILDKGAREMMMSYQPLKRQGTPIDVAHAAVFLASDRAAQVTGILLPIEGGATIGDAVNHLDQMNEIRAAAMAS